MEICTYLPEAEAPELLKEQERIMLEEMRFVIPDVKIKAESALMRRWSKKASAVFGPDGRMAVWEEIEAETDESIVADVSVVDLGF